MESVYSAVRTDSVKFRVLLYIKIPFHAQWCIRRSLTAEIWFLLEDNPSWKFGGQNVGL